MREIKFRAWHKEKRMLVRVIDLYLSDGTVHLPIETDVTDEYWWDSTTWDLKDVELMQYTGLKDKNGKEIYEGDILLFNNSHNDRNNKWKCVVKYREGSFVCEYPVDGVYNHFDSWNVPKVTWEIIGNIYENSDLLEEQ